MDFKRDLEIVYQTALDAGLADPGRRDLLLAWLPASVVGALALRPTPAEQLRADLTTLLQLELQDHQPALSTWLENAERLTDYRVGVPSIFAGLRRKLTAAVLQGSPPPGSPPPGPAPTPPAPPAPESGIGIMLISAQPRTSAALHVGRELRGIRDRLQAGVFRDRLRVSEVELAVRIDQLEERVRRSDAGILHFSGHGTRDGALQFEDAQGGPQEVPATGFVRLLRLINDDREPGRRIVLVVLNACHSAALAQALVAGDDPVVPVAIGTTEAIHDEAAIAFAEGFYSALADGKNLNYAFEAGRLRVEFLEPHLRRNAAFFQLAFAAHIEPKRHFVVPR